VTDLMIVPVGQPTPQQKPPVDPLDFDTVLSHCRWCWGQHPGACPYIKIVEWHPSGQVARVVLAERPDHIDKIVYPGDEEEQAT
jgi:hypothetical protein